MILGLEKNEFSILIFLKNMFYRNLAFRAAKHDYLDFLIFFM